MKTKTSWSCLRLLESYLLSQGEDAITWKKVIGGGMFLSIFILICNISEVTYILGDDFVNEFHSESETGCISTQ
jgi:hypothetical protein